ncbi:MAG TPA: mechanosensitive ion channel family protein [Terriglobales bacterium]|jgi:small-conductance mechanosensitive channel|nr:mechanosensitive ion channel family protein [Terriglobales bacterium]
MVRSAKRLAFITLLAASLLPASLLAQPETQAKEEPQGYPVKVEGTEIFRIYEGIGNFSAGDRAAGASDRFRKLIYSPQTNLANIVVADSPYGTSIMLGENILLVISDDDARHYHITRQALAQVLADRIRNTVAQAREQHTPRYLIRACIYAAVTLLIYVAVCWLLIRGTRWLLKVIEAKVTRLKGFRIQQSQIMAGKRIAAILMTAVRLLRILMLISLTWVFLATEFNYFPWTREHGEQLLNYVVRPVRLVGLAFLNYVPNLFYIAVIVAVMYYFIKLVRVVLREVEQGNIRISGFYPEWAQPTYKIVRFLLIAFTAVVIYPYLPGENSPAFKGVGLFIGVLFSLGSTSAVANVVAGVILIYTRGFRVGDWVKIGDNMGEVMSQTMLATHIKTYKNEEIIIPNSVILSSYVTNYSLLAQNNGLILHTSVTIGYDAPWRQIHSLLIEAALKTKYVLHTPAPFVLQTALQDSYVQYEINAYTDQPAQMVNIYAELHANIQDCFYAGGVEIMSPIFHALRDGNRTAIPDQFLPKDYRPRSFRIERDDSAAAASTGKG